MHSPHHQSEPLLQQAPTHGCHQCLPHYQVPLKDSVDSAPLPKEVDHSPSAPKYSDLPEYATASQHANPLHTLQHTPTTERRKKRVSYHSSTSSVDLPKQQASCQCTRYSTPTVSRPQTPSIEATSQYRATRDKHNTAADHVVLSQQQTKAINSIYDCLQAQQAQLSKINQALNKPLPITACADKICTSANKTTNAVNSLHNKITNQQHKTQETVDYCTCLSVCILLVIMFMLYMILHGLKVV